MAAQVFAALQSEFRGILLDILGVHRDRRWSGSPFPLTPEYIAGGDVWITTGADGQIAGFVGAGTPRCAGHTDLNKLVHRSGDTRLCRKWIFPTGGVEVFRPINDSNRKGLRGATMGLHGMCGYAGGFVGPLGVGLVLDWARSADGWGLTFGHLALIIMTGLFFLRRLGAKCAVQTVAGRSA